LEEQGILAAVDISVFATPTSDLAAYPPNCPMSTEVLISPYPDQEGNKLQLQKILSFMYPIYNHNWRNISTIYIYIYIYIYI